MLEAQIHIDPVPEPEALDQAIESSLLGNSLATLLPQRNTGLYKARKKIIWATVSKDEDGSIRFMNQPRMWE